MDFFTENLAYQQKVMKIFELYDKLLCILKKNIQFWTRQKESGIWTLERKV